MDENVFFCGNYAFKMKSKSREMMETSDRVTEYLIRMQERSSKQLKE